MIPEGVTALWGGQEDQVLYSAISTPLLNDHRPQCLHVYIAPHPRFPAPINLSRRLRLCVSWRPSRSRCLAASRVPRAGPASGPGTPPAPRQHCSPWPIVRDPGRGGKQLVDPPAPRERITANYSHFDSGRFCCSAPSGLQSGANRAAPYNRVMHVDSRCIHARLAPCMLAIMHIARWRAVLVPSTSLSRRL